MRFVIVTGMSGAGKSSVLKMLEDAGYFCVDNLPVPLISKFAEIAYGESSAMEKVALGIDIRNGEGLELMGEALESLSHIKIDYEILYLECDDKVLVKRYKETRRSHPLSGNGRIEDGIEKERAKMSGFRKKADYIIDTSQLLTRELRREVFKIFVDNHKNYSNFFVTILSFGFKYGIPSDSDLVFDVRFLPNPYYIDSMRPQTGNDKDVYDYVMQSPLSGEFLDKLEDMVRFLIPNYVAEGKNQLVVSIGCTGGKHRSVTLANALYSRLESLEYGLKVEHRDIEKDGYYYRK